jgi:hypothetical protein
MKRAPAREWEGPRTGEQTAGYRGREGEAIIIEATRRGKRSRNIESALEKGSEWFFFFPPLSSERFWKTAF